MFALFDKSNNKGQVGSSELGTLIRAFNLNTTETEVLEMQGKVDPKNTGSFTIDLLEKAV